MNNEQLFDKIKKEIEHQISFLEDKPEETLESTIKTLWLKAYGTPKSAEETLKTELPDLSEEQKEVLKNLIKQRISGTPLAHIAGRQSFMGIEMLCDSRALIPRKETEILGYEALKICEEITKVKKNPKVLDLCCGSGNLGIALSLHEPGINVYLSDLSQDAIDLAKDNISRYNLAHRIKCYQGNMFEAFNSSGFNGAFDIIVCNPPYISTAKVNKMNDEISGNEPNMAFDGGLLGTKIIQQLLNEAPTYLVNNGHLLFEIGLGQGDFIYKLCLKNKRINTVSTVSDTKNNIRVIHCII